MATLSPCQWQRDFGAAELLWVPWDCTKIFTLHTGLEAEAGANLHTLDIWCVFLKDITYDLLKIKHMFNNAIDELIIVYYLIQLQIICQSWRSWAKGWSRLPELVYGENPRNHFRIISEASGKKRIGIYKRLESKKTARIDHLPLMWLILTGEPWRWEVAGMIMHMFWQYLSNGGHKSSALWL